MDAGCERLAPVDRQFYDAVISRQQRSRESACSQAISTRTRRRSQKQKMDEIQVVVANDKLAGKSS